MAEEDQQGATDTPGDKRAALPSPDERQSQTRHGKAGDHRQRYLSGELLQEFFQERANAADHA
jgi:hypothetical protein